MFRHLTVSERMVELLCDLKGPWSTDGCDNNPDKMNSHVVSIIHLKGKKYLTWKVQCQMALMKEGVWGIVQGTEATQGPTMLNDWLNSTTGGTRHSQLLYSQ